MQASKLNLCPTCEHNASCVLTSQKETVWSCSEYDEYAGVAALTTYLTNTNLINTPKTAVA